MAPALGAADSNSSVWLIDPQTKCYVLYTDSHPADVVTWSGDCTNQKASGQGTATFTSGNRFVAEVSGSFIGGTASGSVRANWADGGHFEGEEKVGRPDGQGVLTAGNGDRFEGRWIAGELNGQGAVTRANGERYQGEWKNNLPNGHGVLTRKDGSKFEGEFIDGEPKPAPVAVASNAQTAPTAQQATAAGAGLLSTATKTDAKNDVGDGETSIKWPDNFAGKKLTSVDGSGFALSVSEGGLSREIENANGTAQTANFTFLNSTQGTVGDSADPGKVLGLFRLSDSGIDIDYADGHSESFGPNSAGGLSMTVRSGELSVCTTWYPEGHPFSSVEREAALANYANRVGLKVPAGKNGASRSTCASNDTEVPAAAPGTLTGQTANPPRTARTTRPNKPQADKAASLKAVGSDQPVVVRASQVHLIDADANASTGDSGADRGLRCLSVETNGANWGFRNACGFPVQFAYCVMGGSDERNSCDGGAVAGAIAANSFDALFEETSLKAEHDLRWIACQGAAGDVVPRLVRADPPSGRCVRGRAT